MRHADLEGALRFLGEAASLEGDHAFPDEVVGEFRTLVPCDWAGYCELDAVRRLDLWFSQDPAYYSAELDEEFWGLYHQHPLVQYQNATGDFQAHKITDCMTSREFRRTETFSVSFRPNGVEHQIQVGLDAPLSHTKVFALDRGSRDFDERDRTVLNLLRPHLARLHRAAETRRRASAALAEIERTEEAVLLLDRSGGIEFATPEAARLLVAYFGELRSRLPADVAAWRRKAAEGEALEVAGPEGSLVFRPIRGGLLLEEQRASQLTAREREILDLVADGKTNAEIAAALWISPCTVRRHLDNVFEKLGVHTRTAAVARLRRTGAAR